MLTDLAHILGPNVTQKVETGDPAELDSHLGSRLVNGSPMTGDPSELGINPVAGDIAAVASRKPVQRMQKTVSR